MRAPPQLALCAVQWRMRDATRVAHTAVMSADHAHSTDPLRASRAAEFHDQHTSHRLPSSTPATRERRVRALRVRASDRDVLSATAYPLRAAATGRGAEAGAPPSLQLMGHGHGTTYRPKPPEGPWPESLLRAFPPPRSTSFRASRCDVAPSFAPSDRPSASWRRPNWCGMRRRGSPEPYTCASTVADVTALTSESTTGPCRCPQANARTGGPDPHSLQPNRNHI